MYYDSDPSSEYSGSAVDPDPQVVVPNVVGLDSLVANEDLYAAKLT